jgi:hypothetical protein
MDADSQYLVSVNYEETANSPIVPAHSKPHTQINYTQNKKHGNKQQISKLTLASMFIIFKIVVDPLARG